MTAPTSEPNNEHTESTEGEQPNPAPEAGDDGNGDQSQQQQESEPELPDKARDKVNRANREANQLRKRLKELEPKAKKWDEAEAANRTEAEQQQARADEAESRAKSLLTSAINAEIRAAAHGWANPGDAPRYVDDKDRFLTEDGEIDTQAITDEVAGVLSERPYLAASQGESRKGPSPDPGQGARGQVSISDQIREAESSGNTREALRLKSQQLLDGRSR